MPHTQIAQTLTTLNIPFRAVNHPAVFTVAESHQHLKDKRPIKNLLLQENGKGRKILVIMDGNTRLDTKALAKSLESKKLSFVNGDVLLETLGVTPGAVSVFGLLHEGATDVEVVLDESLLSEKELGFHPNDNTATLFIPGEALKKIVEHTGHKMYVLGLSA